MTHHEESSDICADCQHERTYHNATGCGIEQCGCQEWTQTAPVGTDHPLTALVECWRKHGRERGYDQWTINYCADELDAALRACRRQEETLTECCHVPLPADVRYCSKCGQEARAWRRPHETEKEQVARVAPLKAGDAPAGSTASGSGEKSSLPIILARHKTCGTVLETAVLNGDVAIYVWCPRCRDLVEHGEIDGGSDGWRLLNGPSTAPPTLDEALLIEQERQDRRQLDAMRDPTHD